MRLSRREFLTSAAACVVQLSLPGAGAGSFADAQGDFVVLDLGEKCALRESLQGYRAVLGEENVRAAVEFAGTPTRWRTAVVPGAALTDQDTASALLDVLGAGGTVLLESGAGFMEPLEFAKHQKMLERFFHINIGEPVDVWREDRSVSYVHYDWPRKVMVRDFSRVVPLVPEEGEVIGRIGRLPVGLTKRLERGRLIFLGSPLGPALRAGDAEAAVWLRDLGSCVK